MIELGDGQVMTEAGHKQIGIEASGGQMMTADLDRNRQQMTTAGNVTKTIEVASEASKVMHTEERLSQSIVTTVVTHVNASTQTDLSVFSMHSIATQAESSVSHTCSSTGTGTLLHSMFGLVRILTLLFFRGNFWQCCSNRV